MEKIAVLGIIVMDLMARSEHLPRAGETVIGHGFAMSPGGKGTNQAIAAKHLGADVSLITKLGGDRFGDMLSEFLDGESLLTDAILKDPEMQSGSSLVMVDENTGVNQITACPNACGAITAADLESVRGIIEGADWLICQLECNTDATLNAIDVAYAKGKKIILNPAPCRELPADLFPKLTIVTPNEVEAAQLVGMDAVTTENAEEACDRLLARGVKNVVITLGEHGAFVKNAEVCALIPPIPVNAIDTTGAGDCFTGALAASLAEGNDLLSAVRFANVAAALSTTKQGTALAMPDRAAVESVL